MKDVQNTKPQFFVALDRVGIKNFKMPIKISQKIGGYQNSIADIDISVNLTDDLKGISMSRLPISVQSFSHKVFNQKVMFEIIENIIYKSEAQSCELIYRFPYFVTKTAPITKEVGMMHYNVQFIAKKDSKQTSFRIKIEVLATSCCPCSREISDNGAHNQKCFITVDCTPKENEWVWVEDIISICEESASCEIYSILKRPDEKYVTEKMYENAKFVEDICRECAVKLNAFDKLEMFKVEARSDESIHQHSAFAEYES